MIIQALGPANGQKFSVLSKNLGLNDKTLFTGLMALKKSGYIEQRNGKLWYLYETKTKK